MRDNNKGFSLTELMVVLVVTLALVCMGAGVYLSGDVRVRGLAFNMMSDFNMARSMAVRSGCEILVELVSRGEVDDDGRVQVDDGYRICIDNDGDANCDQADRMVREVLLGRDLAYYDADIPAPAGPGRTVTGDPWAAGGDGISFTGDRFVMRPNGVSSKAGTVYLYMSGRDGRIGGGPMALVLNRIGRMRISRWRTDLGEWTE